MILDTLDSIDKYFDLHTGMETALTFLVDAVEEGVDDGKYEIDGKKVYASVSNEMGKGKDNAYLETHRKYIDVQFCLEGADHIGWKPAGQITKPAGEYDKKKDVAFFDDEPKEYFTVSGNTFCVLFPHDGHAPLSGSCALRKIVVKIAV